MSIVELIAVFWFFVVVFPLALLIPILIIAMIIGLKDIERENKK